MRILHITKSSERRREHQTLYCYVLFHVGSWCTAFSLILSHDPLYCESIWISRTYDQNLTHSTMNNIHTTNSLIDFVILRRHIEFVINDDVSWGYLYRRQGPAIVLVIVLYWWLVSGGASHPFCYFYRCLAWSLAFSLSCSLSLARARARTHSKWDVYANLTLNWVWVIALGIGNCVYWIMVIISGHIRKV